MRRICKHHVYAFRFFTPFRMTREFLSCKNNKFINYLLSLPTNLTEMRTFFLILLSTFLIIAKAEAQPKHEIRATWLTTLGGMDWPRNKATNASSILKQQQELCAILDN